MAEAHETKLARADGGGAARGPAAVTPGGELVPRMLGVVPDGAACRGARVRSGSSATTTAARSRRAAAPTGSRGSSRAPRRGSTRPRGAPRRDVTATTLVGEVVDAIADELRDDPARIALCIGGPGADAEVLEPRRSFDAQLFGQRTLLRVVRAEAPTEMEM